MCVWTAADVVDVEPQAGEIVDSLAHCCRHAGVARLERRRVLDPLAAETVALSAGAEEVVARSARPGRAFVRKDRDPEDAGVPRGAGLEGQPEQNAAVGELRVGAGVDDVDPEAAFEGVVAVARREPALALVPLALERAPAHELTPLDVEQVGKVAFEADFDLEVDGAGTVVGQVVVLVHAVADGAVEPQVERLGRDGAGERGHGRVGELEARRPRLDHGAVQEHGLGAPQPQAVARHEPGVGREEALLLGARQAPVGVAHEHLVVGVHREHRRPDLHLHGSSTSLPTRGR